jgi:hypothetical protein
VDLAKDYSLLQFALCLSYCHIQLQTPPPPPPPSSPCKTKEAILLLPRGGGGGGGGQGRHQLLNCKSSKGPFFVFQHLGLLTQTRSRFCCCQRQKVGRQEKKLSNFLDQQKQKKRAEAPEMEYNQGCLLCPSCQA